MKNAGEGKPKTKLMDYAKGSYFGEISLLSHAPRLASIYAKVTTTKRNKY